MSGGGDWLAERFEAQRPRLRAMALRMLGSRAEADDAVQEAWLKAARADGDDVDNVGGWLTTIVARVCLDMLRARGSRREEPLDVVSDAPASATAGAAGGTDPEAEAVAADAVGAALLVVLETLEPAERLAFVLHDLFGVPFDEIAPIVDRSSEAARQLASRARRRVRGAAEPAADPIRQRAVVEAFLAASRGGDFDALIALLHPDAVMRADAAGVRMGSPGSVAGARAVAAMFAGRARAARVAVVGGGVGAVWMQDGRARVAFTFDVVDGRIAEIALIGDATRLEELAIAPVPGRAAPE